MKQRLLVLLTHATLSICALPAMAAEPAGSTVAGHYFLRGVTEVGSELLLKRDGKFEWALTYGNQDQQAKGDWHMAGANVVLVADSRNREPRFRVLREEEAHFRRSAEPGLWIATVGVADVGPVSDVEVTFAAKSGKTAVAVSRQNGDAIVRMPATEEWARAGLRRKGSPEDFQWLDVPPQRAQARIASFDITNPEVIGAMPFHELTLHVANGELRVADPGNGLAQGMYIKQK